MIVGSNVGLVATGIVDSGDPADAVGGMPDPANINADASCFVGPRADNPFLADSPDLLETTPVIAGLAGGAEIFGLLADINRSHFDYDPLAYGQNDAPDDALVAIFRFDHGVLVNGGQLEASIDYTGFDMVVVVNVTNINLPLPRLSLILPGSEQPDFAQGLAIAGLGETASLASLPAGAAWATLVPETDDLLVNASLTFDGSDDPTNPLVQAALDRGTSEFVVSFVSARKPSLGTDANIQGFEAIAISPDGQHVYGVDGGQNALVVVNTLGLTQRQLLKEGMNDPAGAIVHGLIGATDIAIAEGRDVYVASPTQHSVAIFTRDAATGDRSFRGTVTIPGQDVFDTLALSPDGARLFVAGEDGIAIYDRDLAGDLSASDLTLTTPIAFEGVGGLSELAPSGDGRFLYAVSPASNTLLVLDATSLVVVERFDGDAYGLTGASDLAVSRDDRFVYVTAQSGHTLSVFRRGLDDDVSHFQTLANGVAGVRGLAGPSDVAITPDQSFVLVTAALSDAVAVFQHDAETERLAFVQVLRNNIGGASGLESPRAIATTPAGTQTPGYEFVGSDGDGMSLGGLALLEINTSHPEPIQLMTSFANTEALNIITGAGSDTLSLVQAPTAEVVSTTIRTGANNDLVTLLDLSPKTKVVLGEDDDQIQVRADTAGVELLIYGDEEDDSLVHCDDVIVIERVGPDTFMEVFGGPGRDIIRVSGANLAASSTTVVHGNEPANTPGEEGDMLILDPQDPYALLDLPPFEGQVRLQDRGLLIYDTFEGDVVIALAPSIEFTGAQFVADSYRIAEGDTVTLSVSVTPYGSANGLSGPVTWDLNGDGIFEEGMGETLVLTWERLADLGIGDDGLYQIGASATNMEGYSAQAFATLEVVNTPPAVEIAPVPAAFVGEPFELVYSASDPGTDGIIQWRIDWGDGTPVEVLGSGASAATHVFQQPGKYIVRVAAVDEDVPAGVEFSELPQQSTEVDVSVRASDVSAGGPYAIAEGQDLELLAKAVGLPESFSWYVNGAAGGALGRVPTLTWTQLESLGVTDSGTFSVRVEVTYASGLTVESAEVVLEVGNVAPTAELNNDGPVDEGSAGVVVWFTAPSDPSAADRAAGFRYSYDFDSDGVFEHTDIDQASFLVPAQYLTDDGTVRVRAVIKDQDEGVTELFTDIIVRPVAAQLVLSGADDAVEGAVYSLDLAADDPGDDTITQWIVNWGDGTTEVYGTGPQSVEHRFADDGLWTISVTAVDEDGIYIAAKDVRVSNAAPELSVLNDLLSPIAENELATLTATIREPGVLDSFVLEVQWGDGAEESFALPAGTTSVTLVHRFADDGNYSINLSLWDDDGGLGSASTSVEVANAAPVIGSIGLASRVVSESELVIVTGSISDAGALDTHVVTIQWGDGSDSEAVVDPATRTFRATHRYLDDDPTGTPLDDYSITATVVDNSGDTSSRSTALTVVNLPPIVTALQISETDADGWVTLTGRFVDAGTADTHSVLIDWSDGAMSDAEVDQDVFSFTATHRYVTGGGTGQLTGGYFITATVSDDDGSQDTASVVIASEGQTAVYRGEIPGGAAMTLQASVGTVVDNGDGTWNWSYDTKNGPDESQSVKITATNSDGVESTEVFNLVVSNVAPVVMAAPDQTCEQASPTDFLLGSFVDPGDDQPWEVVIDWGDGSTVETFLLMSPGPLGSRSHTYADTGVYLATVTAGEQDGSGELGSASFEVVVAAPTPRYSISGCVYVDVNNNGRRDAAEIGLPNVPVTLTGSALRTVLTGPDGCYFFTELPSGTYHIQELQPQAFLDGIDTPGGPSPCRVENDAFLDVELNAHWPHASGYDFGERGLRSHLISLRLLLASSLPPTLLVGSLILDDGDAWAAFTADDFATLTLTAESEFDESVMLEVYDASFLPVALGRGASLETVVVPDQSYVIYVSGTGVVNARLVVDQSGTYTNALMPLDVNADCVVSPIDALLIINRLNTTRSRLMSGPHSTPPFYDTNADAMLSPIDVLLVISWLNRQDASGEGEAVIRGDHDVEVGSGWPIAAMLNGTRMSNQSEGQSVLPTRGVSAAADQPDWNQFDPCGCPGRASDPSSADDLYEALSRDLLRHRYGSRDDLLRRRAIDSLLDDGDWLDRIGGQ